MELFEQTFLKPGTIGELVVTTDDNREYVDGTNAMIAAGYEPPLILEHAEKGSEEGAPRNRRDAEASKVLHGAGWIKAAKLNDDGSASYTIEATDPTVAEKLRNKSIKFTSPELRPVFKDGNGVEHRKVIAHVALTHKPRFIGQGEIIPIQLSLINEPVQFSLEDVEDKPKDSDADGKPDAVDPEPENPDMPPKATDKTKLAAVLAGLDQMGLKLPSDFDFSADGAIDILLTAVNTSIAAKQSAEADAAEEEPAGEATEDSPPVMQFSLADVTAGKVENKLLGKVIRQQHDGLVSRLDKLVSEARITPKLRDALTKETALQFSADADELPAFTLGQVADLLENNTTIGQAWDAAQLSTLETEEPPTPETSELTPEQARKIVDEQAKYIPTLRTAK